MSDRLFSALLKYWRSQRGQSQLDLALAANVSPRHVSFLESGRAQPSVDMVLRLMAALDVPLRDQNQALSAAGFEPRFPEPSLADLPPGVDWAIERMLQQQEPYPLTVLSPHHDVVRRNDAATRLFEAFAAEPERLPPTPNMFQLLFDPGLVRPFVVQWEQLARRMLSRLHREVLQHQGDARSAALLDSVLQHSGVPREWRQPDFSTDLGGTVTVGLQRGDLALNFLTTITAFSAPQLVTLQELRIESYFPLDEPTRIACQNLAAG